MNLKAIVTAAMFLLAHSAFAQGGFDHEDGPGPRGGGGPDFQHHKKFDPLFFEAVLADGKGPKEGPCADLKLDKAQKVAIKEAYFKFKGEVIDLEASLKKAELAEEKVKFDDKATFEAAELTSKAKIDALTKVMTAHDSLRNELEFKILRPEQRGPARMCEMMHRWHGPHEGDKRPDKGPHGKKDQKDNKDADKK